MGGGGCPHRTCLVQDVHAAPVPEHRYHQLGQPVQGRVGIQRLGQHGAGLRQQGQPSQQGVLAGLVGPYLFELTSAAIKTAKVGHR